MKPVLPRLDLESLDRQYENVLQLFLSFKGEELQLPLCAQIAREAELLLDGTDAVKIQQTLRQYEGRKVDYAWAEVISRQFVARRKELVERPLPMFVSVVTTEWVAVEIVDMDPCEWRDSNGQVLHLRCLTGRPAGQVLKKRVPEGWLAWLAYQIGYTRRLRYSREPTDLVGFRLWGLTAPSETASKELDFEEVKITPALKKWNQSIIYRRGRFDIPLDKIPASKISECECPKSFDHLCQECPVHVSECRASYNYGEPSDGRGHRVPEPGRTAYLGATARGAPA